MKYAIVLVISLFTSAANAGVINAFNGQYDLSLWTHEENTGQIILTDAPNSLTQISSDEGTQTPINTDSTITALEDGTVSFDWDYSTDDFSAAFDQFGWLLNDVFELLTEDTGSLTQSGSFSFLVEENDSFGFRTVSSDSDFGSSTTIVSNFSFTPSSIDVPEPSTIMLFALALFGFSVIRKQINI